MTPHANIILIATNSNSGHASFDAVHGGESLLGRALVASSKSGMECVYILAMPKDRPKIDRLIDEVRARVLSKITVFEAQPDSDISGSLSTISVSPGAHFLVADVNAILHPSFLKPAIEVAVHSEKATLIAYDHVTIADDVVTFSEELQVKYRVIFQAWRHLNRVQASDHKYVLSPSLKSGHFSTDILVCRTEHLQRLPPMRRVTDLVNRLNSMGHLTVGHVGNAWWLKIHDHHPPEAMREFFWKIAFKEISGEFSKAVNSKFSKPMTFLFVRFRVAPNTISRLSLLLYMLATALLVIPSPWALVGFGLLWQFSAGVLDRCDGETARMRNYESDAGADFDVLIDDLRFFLPLGMLGAVCFVERPYDITSLFAASLALVWSFVPAFREVRMMHAYGYKSRQVMARDIVKGFEPAKGSTKWFHFFRPFFKGDVRTFYVFLSCLSGNKVVALWVMILNAIVMGILSVATILQLKKLKHLKA